MVNKKNVEIELNILKEVEDGFMVKSVIRDGGEIEINKKVIYAKSEINALAFALSYFTRKISNAVVFVRTGNEFFMYLLLTRSGKGEEFSRLYGDAYSQNKVYKSKNDTPKSLKVANSLNLKNESIIEVQAQIIEELKKLNQLLANDNELLRDYIGALDELGKLEAEEAEEENAEEKTEGEKL